MEYYMTRMDFHVAPFFERTHIEQLVKASTKENARKCVEKTAKEQFGEQIMILEIRVHDTLIGE